jgi:hypothetical protein
MREELDDARLTAYVLGELPGRQHSRCARRLQLKSVTR